MLILSELLRRKHESVSVFHHESSGLMAVLALHSTVLGPAVCATRMRPCRRTWYSESMEQEPLEIALALSESITLKAALAGLNCGGGACVIVPSTHVMEDEQQQRWRPHSREALFRALGRELSPLSGRIILTEDVGVEAEDIDFVAQESRGTLRGKTSSATAYGVYRGMKAAARHVLGSESLRGVAITVYGLGALGRELSEHLRREEAVLTLADPRPRLAQELAHDLQANFVDHEAAFSLPCDIFSPCGQGGSLAVGGRLAQLNCRMIAGGEHHPVRQADEAALLERGVAYVPDFALNGGGLLAASLGRSAEEAAERMYKNVMDICERAEHDGRSLAETARHLAERRIRLIGSLGRTH